MASDNTVNVEITASVAGLKSGLSQAEKGIKGFGTSATNMTNKTNKMAGAVKVNAVPAMTSFSQVIQDAPYGIRGVANNITQLTSQLGYLSKNAGGTKAAFKSMLTTLTGPAGILLAVSVITSLLVSYGDELANIGSESAKAAEKQKDLAESLKSTSSVLGAQVDTLNAQIDLLEAQNLPTKELLATKLKILEADLQTTVQQRASLYNQIESVKAASTQLSLAEKILNVYNLTKGLGVTQFAGIDKEEQKKIDELSVSLANADKTIAQLSLSIGKLRSPDIFDTKKIKSNAEEAKRAIVEPIQTALTEDIPQLQQTSLSGLGADFWQRVWQYEELEAQKEKVLLALNDFNLKASSIIQSGISNTFAGIGEGIGTALVEGGNVLASAGSALLGGLGSILVELGKMAIATGVGLIAVKLSLETLGGFGAIAAGIALVALGSAFSSGSKSLGSSMGSGSSSYSSGASDTNYVSSTSYASSGGGGGGTYVFEIAGTKLIGVLKNTLDRNKQLGGSNNLVFG